jgi:5-methylcytosine-specific restriction endonuclease McrA
MTPQQRYRVLHPERCRAARRASYAKNPAIELASSKTWRSRNIEKVRADRRDWYAEDIQEQRSYHRARQAARRAGDGNVFTDDDVHLIWELQDGLCFYCNGETNGRIEHVDHFIPLKRGGSNARFNIAVACRTCNCKKGSKSPLEFMGFLKFKLPPLWEEQFA